tara:strand:- start:1718 stop:1825 length:108 start_codon:yes stop_codon:yes gene_type:complete
MASLSANLEWAIGPYCFACSVASSTIAGASVASLG